MKEPSTEELLNSFIDGELTERHRIEVARLISHDARAAQRLRELQKCKMLVNSLPRADAPQELAEQVKTSLERRTPLVQQPAGFRERKGARHLLARKVLTVAAMIGLVAGLATVIYTIVAPESVAPATGFYGRLELKTSDLMVVDAVVSRAIEDNNISRESGTRSQKGKSVYALSCSREALSLLLADLGDIWEKFDSATLFVQTKAPGKQVVVEGVSAEQIVDLITPPKPRLTGDERITGEPTARTQDEKKVHLTIVLAGSE